MTGISWIDMMLTPLALWTMAVSVLCSVPCAVLGCFLVLRRMSLLGDAISHAVLPGIAIAFLLTGQVTGWPVVVGAMALGVLTAFLTQTVHWLGEVPEDASMGVVFTSLFALGVILITSAASGVDLDPGCVLYGLIEFIPLDTLWGVPRAVFTLLPVAVLTLGFVALFWKELKVASFDPSLASAMGFSALLVHYLLMALVAGVTVASFEAVGAILVVAMLIVPGATAHLLADRLAPMLAWAAGLAVVASVAGYAGAAALNTSVAGMMAVMLGVEFGLAVLLAPRHGLVSKALHNLQLALRIACEDVLAGLYRTEEAAGRGERPATATPEEARHSAGRLAGWLALPVLRRRGWVEPGPDGEPALTVAGRQQAQFVVRSHRLWEAFLDQQGVLPPDHLHDPAERMEHYIGPGLQEALAEQLRQDADPHGRPIPPAETP